MPQSQLSKRMILPLLPPAGTAAPVRITQNRGQERIAIVLSPGLTDIPMDGILGPRLLRWKVELVQDHIVCLGVVFDPFSDSYLKSIIIKMIEYASARFVLICSDERAFALVLESLLAEFFFPDVLMKFRARYSPLGGIRPGVIAQPV